jgi:hypothetical protein
VTTTNPEHRLVASLHFARTLNRSTAATAAAAASTATASARAALTSSSTTGISQLSVGGIGTRTSPFLARNPSLRKAPSFLSGNSAPASTYQTVDPTPSASCISGKGKEPDLIDAPAPLKHSSSKRQHAGGGVGGLFSFSYKGSVVPLGVFSKEDYASKSRKEHSFATDADEGLSDSGDEEECNNADEERVIAARFSSKQPSSSRYMLMTSPPPLSVLQRQLSKLGSSATNLLRTGSTAATTMVGHVLQLPLMLSTSAKYLSGGAAVGGASDAKDSVGELSQELFALKQAQQAALMGGMGSKDSPLPPYQPLVALSASQGLEAAVVAYFGFLDRGGAALDERLVLPAGTAEHMSVRRLLYEPSLTVC